MNKKVLITGVSGFVGNHLTREFITNGYVVVGISREEEGPEGLSSYTSADLAEADSFNDIPLKECSGIVHLAGLAAVGPSFDRPRQYIDINAAVTISLLEAALRAEYIGRIIVVSTGALYDSNQSMPIGEDGVLALNSPYAISKMTVENLCEYYRKRGLNIVAVRPFNHIGPKQGPGFIVPDLNGQILDAVNNQIPLLVGNLKTRRDYTDVRDVANAYRLLIETETLQHTTYNVCSGKSHSGEDILHSLLSAHNLSDKDVRIKVDASKVRPNDAPDIVGSNKRLTADTGWQPSIDLDQTIRDFVANA